jgi:fumarate hydratase class II
MLPVLAKNLLDTTALLASASSLLAGRCIAGIVADRERMLDHARRSPAIVTALNPIVGYERAAAFVKEAETRGISVAEVITEHDVLPPEELARVLDVLSLTRRLA